MTNPITQDHIPFKVSRCRDTSTFKSDIFGQQSQNHNRMRSSCTFDSSIFKNNIDKTVYQQSSQAIFQDKSQNVILYKIPDHPRETFFGDGKGMLVRNKSVQNTFVPLFKEEAYSCKDRKFYEQFNQDNYYNITQQQRLSVPRETSKERPKTSQECKFNEMKSQIFYGKSKIRQYSPSPDNSSSKLIASTGKWNDKGYASIQKKRDVVLSAKDHKFMEFQSSVLNQSETKYKELPPQKQQDDNHYQQRQIDRNYSDLFGMDHTTSSQRVKSQYASIADWKKVDSEKIKSIKVNQPEFTAEQKKINEFKSVLDSHNYVQQKSKLLLDTQNTFKDFDVNKQDLKTLKKKEQESNVFHQNAPKDYQNGQLHTLNLNNINGDFNENQFKKYCAQKGFHIVDIKPQYDNILAKDTDRAILRYRTNDNNSSQKLEQELKNAGIAINYPQDKFNLNTKYKSVANLDWKDQNLTKEDHKLNTQNFTNSTAQKQMDLQSNGQLFGNSSGVGQWNTDWKQQRKNENLNQNVSQDSLPTTKQYQAQTAFLNTMKNFQKRVFTPVLSQKKNLNSSMRK